MESLNVIILGQDNENNRNRRANIDWADNLNCKIPKLDINGSEVMKFFSKAKPLPCGSKPKEWAYIDSNRVIRVTDETFRKYGEPKCIMKAFSSKDDVELIFDEPIHFRKKIQLNTSDFAKVVCISAAGDFWGTDIMTIVPKQNRIKELLEIKKPDDWSGLDVYFLGFDSVSHMTFRRKLPLTVKFLEKELEAVVLNGYNIVGDGTPQAFIPILTAKTEEELPMTRKRYKNAHFVDEVYPFVWNNFSDAGYITMFAEDSAAIGTYTYRLKGFKKQPTDHYLRTYFMEFEKYCEDCECVGSRPLYEDWFRYTSEFMLRYKEVPKFLLAHQSRYSHDSLDLVEVEDEHIVQHFRELLKTNVLNNSVIITMADHGHRFANIRQTHQGQLEERLPFFSIAMPRWFRESDKGRTAWKNLQENKDRLTTPFDIHATLMDILHWPSENELKRSGDLKKRSLSLFRPIPSSRTCAQAGIDPHWCTCLTWESAMGSEQLDTSKMLVNVALEAINSYTEPERKLCAKLNLEKFENAKRLVPNAALLSYRNALDRDGFVPDLTGTTSAKFAHYQLSFRTTPGNALYEVTLLYDWNVNSVTIDMKSISHVNKYGDLPHCIIDKNYFMAMYCVCYDKIS